MKNLLHILKVLLVSTLAFTILVGCAASKLETQEPVEEPTVSEEPVEAEEEQATVSTVSSTAVTESVVPGNFNFYDYFADVYGFDKSTAAKITVDGTETDYYFSVRNHLTVNERSAKFLN